MDEVAGTDVITSPSDLSASFTAEAPSTEASTPEPEDGLAEPESPDSEGPSLLGELNETGEETPETAEEEQAVDEAEPEATEATEELPDGVHAVDRNGKKEYRLNAPRYEAFHGAYKSLREFSDIAGEPMTKEAFELRNNALLAEDRLYSDMVSGDPNAQAKVIGHFFAQAKAAQENGDVAGNPMIPFTQQYYETIRQSDPDAYATLRHSAAKDLVQEMYAEAAQQQSKSLFLSAGHIAKTLGLPYKPEVEMSEFFTKRGEVDPGLKLRQENEQLRAQLNGRQAETAEQQFSSWKAETGKSIRAGIMDDAIIPATSSIAEQGYWKTHPEAFTDLVVNRLNSAVTDAVKKDARLNERIADLDKAAKRAPSEQRRAEIRTQMRQLYVNKANLVIEGIKPKILKDASDRVREQNAGAHQRRQSAQTHRAPSGGTPIKRSLIPIDADFEVGNPDNLKASLNRLLA